MECRSKEPVHLTYRAVGSSTGQKEFVGPDDKDIGYDFHEQDFGAGDIPMTQSYFDTMKGQNRDMVHVPITVGAIGVFHSVPESDLAQPLHLDACTLGLIYEASHTLLPQSHASLSSPLSASSHTPRAHFVCTITPLSTPLLSSPLPCPVRLPRPV